MKSVAKNTLKEVAYRGNLGIHELMLFYDKASKTEIKKLEMLLSSKKIKPALDLVEKVLGYKLHTENTVERSVRLMVRRELKNILGKSIKGETMQLKNLLPEWKRKKIKKDEAKKLTPKKNWDEFLKKMKEDYPGKKPTFYYDGGMVYAEIATFAGSTSIRLTGQYGVQD